MSAVIIDFCSRLAQRLTPVEQVRARIGETLERAGYPATVICQAKARAARNVSAGIAIDEAVRRVVAWAENQLSPFLPPAA